jgi:hypothetical protein
MTLALRSSIYQSGEKMSNFKYLRIYFIWAFIFSLSALFIQKALASAVLPPPGGQPTIGGPVVDGTDKSVLFVNPSGTLDQDNPNFIYDKATGLLTAPDVEVSNLSGGACYVDAGSQLQSELYLALERGGTGIDSSAVVNGQLLIGGSTSNDFQLATLTGTANQVNVTNGNNSITLSTPQDIATTSDVTFDSVTATTALASQRVQATTPAGLSIRGMGGVLVGTAGASSGQQLLIEGALQGRTSLMLEDPGVGTDFVTIQAPTLSSGYTMTLPTANAAGSLKNNGSGVLSFSAIDLATSDITGTLAVGNGGTGVTALSDVLGTTNQVSVSGGTSRVIGGDVTLSLPQDIHTAASPTFAGATLYGDSVQPQINLEWDGANPSVFYINNLGTNSGATIGSSASQPIQFRTNNIPRLAIQGTGEVLVGATTEDGSAKLQVDSTTQGFLPPRMDGTDRDAISSPAAGLVIYNTSTNQLNIYNGTSWGAVGGAVYIDNFTGTTITTTNDATQVWRYTGSSAQTLSAITATASSNGTLLEITGTSDTNTITLNNNDVSGGWILNGSWTGHQYSKLVLRLDTTFDRWVEVSRNAL